MFIADKDNTDDNIAYEDIRITEPSEATNAEIDANPYFREAEHFIIAALPIVALSRTGSGEGRHYPQRPRFLSALAYLAVSYFIEYGQGSDTSEETSSEVIKSETVDDIRTEYVTGSSQKLSVSSGDERADNLRNLAYRILESLGATIEDTEDQFEAIVVSTKTKSDY